MSGSRAAATAVCCGTCRKRVASGSAHAAAVRQRTRTEAHDQGVHAHEFDALAARLRTRNWMRQAMVARACSPAIVMWLVSTGLIAMPAIGADGRAVLQGQDHHRAGRHRRPAASTTSPRASRPSISARFIPGNPDIVVQYTPGGGGLVTANRISNATRARRHRARQARTRDAAARDPGQSAGRSSIR